MTERSLEKRASRSSLKQKGPYALAFGIIALMLYVVGFPVFLLAFFGVLAFFIWKALATVTDIETTRIFELFLSANEILRDDGRKWYGFEVREAIAKGDAIVASLPAAPPLVYFVLGALHSKAGDHRSAVEYLEKALGETSVDEMSIESPSPELRNYVRTLRKIECSRSEAPVTSSAIRSLERMRRKKGAEMLEASRRHIGSLGPNLIETRKDQTIQHQAAKRSTISEVLHDVYDENIQ